MWLLFSRTIKAQSFCLWQYILTSLFWEGLSPRCQGVKTLAGVLLVEHGSSASQTPLQLVIITFNAKWVCSLNGAISESCVHRLTVVFRLIWILRPLFVVEKKTLSSLPDEAFSKDLNQILDYVNYNYLIKLSRCIAQSNRDSLLHPVKIRRMNTNYILHNIIFVAILCCVASFFLSLVFNFLIFLCLRNRETEVVFLLAI